nr:membrane-spanning 4-domains subfamily A member 13 isoform X3 [Myodes glareolus]
MLGVYHVLMWYFLLLLYMGQIKGVFGTYEPLTYKMGTGLWGLAFIFSGTFTIRAAKVQNNKYLLLCALSLNILCIIVTIIAASLTIVELAHFRSVSYRNYGQAISALSSHPQRQFLRQQKMGEGAETHSQTLCGELNWRCPLGPSSQNSGNSTEEGEERLRESEHMENSRRT